MSHSCVESLAVGTIPVLEYVPALTDGDNCLTYSGRDGFRRDLSRLQELDLHEIEKLREGAVRYYEEHLGPDQII